jgi:hypothetical protein
MIQATVNLNNGTQKKFEFEDKYLPLVQKMQEQKTCSGVRCKDCPFFEYTAPSADCSKGKGFSFQNVASIEISSLQAEVEALKAQVEKLEKALLAMSEKVDSLVRYTAL